MFLQKKAGVENVGIMLLSAGRGAGGVPEEERVLGWLPPVPTGWHKLDASALACSGERDVWIGTTLIGRCSIPMPMLFFNW